MTGIAQNQGNDQREISATLGEFYADYGVAGLHRACRGEKHKGFSAFRLFQYLLCLVFSDRSMYMQLATGRFAEAFGKNTVYRFLSAAKTNWERLVLQLIVDAVLQTVREHFGLSEEQLLDFTRQFYDRLPASYQRFLQAPAAA
ncbi:MAG: hypothetical protein IKH77_07605 [Clostridia bacterium]|nr:hypothetical protein [Clostridia bacterium]